MDFNESFGGWFGTGFRLTNHRFSGHLRQGLLLAGRRSLIQLDPWPAVLRPAR
jgi:hypothetical protein